MQRHGHHLTEIIWLATTKTKSDWFCRVVMSKYVKALVLVNVIIVELECETRFTWKTISPYLRYCIRPTERENMFMNLFRDKVDVMLILGQI